MRYLQKTVGEWKVMNGQWGKKCFKNFGRDIGIFVLLYAIKVTCCIILCEYDRDLSMI